MDWTQNMLDGTAVTHTGTKLMDYNVESIITPALGPQVIHERVCGKEEEVSVIIRCENDLAASDFNASNVTLTNGTFVTQPQLTEAGCYPKIEFRVRTNVCGATTIQLERTNTVGTQTDIFSIEPSVTKLRTATGALQTSGQVTDFCIQGGPVNIIFLAPTNQPLFGTTSPTFSDLVSIFNCGHQVEWDIISASSIGGLTLDKSNALTDLGYKLATATQAGVYLVEFTFRGCGGSFSKVIRIEVCDAPPSHLAMVPPIDLQNICSLDGPLCRGVGVGCISQMNISSNDSKLLAYENPSVPGELCLGSIFPRRRTSQVTLSTQNACGVSNTVTWNIHIDDFGHCNGGLNPFSFRLNEQGNTLFANLEGEVLGAEQEDELMQSIEIYDINGRLMLRKENINAKSIDLNTSDLQAQKIYVVQMKTNLNTYTEKFIKQ